MEDREEGWWWWGRLPEVMKTYGSKSWVEFIESHVMLWERLKIVVTVATYSIYLVGSLLLGCLFNTMKSSLTKKRVSNTPLLSSICHAALSLSLANITVLLSRPALPPTPL